MEIITCRHLTKVYRRFEKEEGLRGSVKSLFRRKFIEKRALSDFDLNVREGECVGVIGPNGAGKTTLTKLLTGIIRKSGGELSVLGRDPNRLEDALKRQYAVVMGQKSQLLFELTAADTFLLMKELYAIPDAKYRENLGFFVDLFGVRDLLHVQVRALSLGERMKMELIAALLHDPRVLFLDEPTIGLDAVAQKQIRAFLRGVNREKGTTILLTSHYMDDIRALCERCVVVTDGKKIYDGETDALFQRYQTHRRIVATFAQGEAPETPAGAELLERSAHRLALRVPRGETSGVLRALVDDAALSDLSIEEEDIGTVVERIYAGGETA